MAEAFSIAYFDTSALVKRYVTEAGTPMVKRLLGTHRVVSSVLLRLESLSAIRRRHTERRLSDRQFASLKRRLELDEASWELLAVTDEVLAAARRHVEAGALRTLDAIHLASATVAAGQGLRLPFVTADAKQAHAARGTGLDVIEVRG